MKKKKSRFNHLYKTEKPKPKNKLTKSELREEITKRAFTEAAQENATLLGKGVFNVITDLRSSNEVSSRAYIGSAAHCLSIGRFNDEVT